MNKHADMKHQAAEFNNHLDCITSLPGLALWRAGGPASEQCTRNIPQECVHTQLLTDKSHTSEVNPPCEGVSMWINQTSLP